MYLLFTQPQGYYIWLGANDLVSEGNWTWQSAGNVSNFTNFSPGEPNGGVDENCLAMTQDNGNWSDINCMYPYSYHLCEKQVPPPPTTPAIRESEFHHQLFSLFGGCSKTQNDLKF